MQVLLGNGMWSSKKDSRLVATTTHTESNSLRRRLAGRRGVHRRNACVQTMGETTVSNNGRGIAGRMRIEQAHCKTSVDTSLVAVLSWRATTTVPGNSAVFPFGTGIFHGAQPREQHSDASGS